MACQSGACKYEDDAGAAAHGWTGCNTWQGAVDAMDFQRLRVRIAQRLDARPRDPSTIETF